MTERPLPEEICPVVSGMPALRGRLALLGRVNLQPEKAAKILLWGYPGGPDGPLGPGSPLGPCGPVTP